MKSHKELIVWQKAYKLVLEIYRITKKFPREETYCLISQIRSAAISVPSNIAEGYNRQSRKEYIHFLFIAYSSCAELDTQILMAYDLKYLSQSDFDSINLLIEEVMKMLNRLIYKLKSKP